MPRNGPRLIVRVPVGLRDLVMRAAVVMLSDNVSAWMRQTLRDRALSDIAGTKPRQTRQVAQASDKALAEALGRIRRLEHEREELRSYANGLEQELLREKKKTGAGQTAPGIRPIEID